MVAFKSLVIRGDVQLSPLTCAEAPAMYRWMLDPVVANNVGLRSEPTLEKTLEWIRNATGSFSVIRPYAIRVGTVHVGNVVFDRIDEHLGSTRFSIYIGEPTSRGYGIGAAATYLGLRAAFSTLELHKVWLTVHAENFRALRTYSRIGFSLEGILRDEFRLNGAYVSLVYMGMLSEEFSAIRVESRP